MQPVLHWLWSARTCDRRHIGPGQNPRVPTPDCRTPLAFRNNLHIIDIDIAIDNMSSDTEQSAQPLVNGIVDDERPGLMDEPSTPREEDDDSIPSTQAPNSPVDPASSFKTELNDDRAEVIPSSLTPPPSSQVPTAGAGAPNPLGLAVPQRTGIFSPPATGLNGVKRDIGIAAEYAAPTAQQINEASTEALRTMLQASITEHAKLKMEAAHHKLQYNLLSLQADEDSKRAAVEHEMTRKEVEALRIAEDSRQARHDLTVPSEPSQAKYLQLKLWYEQALEELEAMHKKFKAARKVIQQKEEENASLADERDMLLNRIRENREHFHLLCSPGGIFHGAVPSKTQTAVTPVQHRATPRQTPRPIARESRTDRDHSKENFAVLLQALNQENNSEPSTPVTGHHRPAPRHASKHTRNVQSMSSLPTTPIGRPRPESVGLLPSVDLVPQTEPPYRNTRFIPETPVVKTRERRRSRESTISAEDNEELARQALRTVAAASFASRASRMSGDRPGSGDEEEEEIFESQASQAASEMLRRDPRESFEVASSVNSRDVTPAPADKSATLQAKLFGPIIKSGVVTSEKRKFSGHHGDTREDGTARDALTSPAKKLRVAGGLRDPARVGLGIRYSG